MSYCFTFLNTFHTSEFPSDLFECFSSFSSSKDLLSVLFCRGFLCLYNYTTSLFPAPGPQFLLPAQVLCQLHPGLLRHQHFLGSRRGGEPGRVEPFPLTTRVSPCRPFPLSPVLFPLCSPEELCQPCLQPHLLPPLGLCRGLRMGAHLHYGSGVKEIKVKSFPQAFRVL